MDILRRDHAAHTDAAKVNRPNRAMITILCLLGISLNLFLVLPNLRYVVHGDNDFLAFYAGSALAGTPDLYNQEAVRRVQAPNWENPRTIAYMRLPFYAGMIWPLHFFRFQTAYWVWQAVSLLSLLLFVYWWPEPDRGMTAVACCWSMPLLNCFIMGQDLMFVMLILAVALRLLLRDKPFAAGCILSLCCIKYNLFLMLPLLIVRKRMWRLAVGVAAGGSVLLAISFAVGGWSWPLRYIAMLRLPTTTPYYGGLPNLHGLFFGQPHGAALEVLAAALVLAVSWRTMKSDEVRAGFAAMLAGGLLLSYHAFFADAFVMAPASLLFLSRFANPAYKLVALVLVLPFAFWQYLLAAPLIPPVAVFLAVLLLMFLVENAPPGLRKRLYLTA